MITFNKNTKYTKGFTLIEIMVAVTIFALVVLVAIGAVVAIVGADKKAQSLNDVINNMNFSVESMVRDLRTGYNYSCSAGVSDGNACTSITFTSTISSQAGDQITYTLDTSRGVITKTDEDNDLTQDLTSSNIKVNRLDFYIQNTGTWSSGEPPRQPLILMILQAKSTTNGGEQSEFNIQTLISQRKLNVPTS